MPLALKVLTCVAVVAALAVAFTVHVLPRLAPSQTAVTADSNTHTLYPAASLSATQLGQTASLMQARLASVEGSSAEMLDIPLMCGTTDDAGSLAVSALAEAQAAYEEMGFESGPFTQLAYSFGGTSSNPAGTIVFKKHRAMTESETSSVEVQFAAAGDLSDALNTQAATDEFYADKLAS